MSYTRPEPISAPLLLRETMLKAFEGVVGNTTCDHWALDLIRYDKDAIEVLTGHLSGVLRPSYHVIFYKDLSNNILSFIIPISPI